MVKVQIPRRIEKKKGREPCRKVCLEMSPAAGYTRLDYDRL
jgi:hypothetical protein